MAITIHHRRKSSIILAHMSLVSMFRCKKCKVRMFERDCAGHLSRHGIDISKFTNEEVLSYFERGPRTARARPGDGLTRMNYGKKKRKVVVDDLDDESLN